MMSLVFENVARLAAPHDNVAIAIQNLEAGSHIIYDDDVLSVSHTILVGHRFAIQDIAVGESLLSWGQTFGTASEDIHAGDYVINADVLQELHRRSLNIELPQRANFQNDFERYQLDKETFQPAQQLSHYDTSRYFWGYRRGGGRGVGTRNTIILLGTTAIVAGFVRKLEDHLKPYLEQYPNINGIVAVTHTEGAHGKPNNEDLLLRTLAGFIVHPNVAAVLIVDDGNQAINNESLQRYMQREPHPLEAVLHHFLTLSESFEDDIQRGEAIVSEWFDTVNDMERTPQPLSELKIALQCGGSDAFSGISGNPLAAWVAKEIIRYGGSANLAETDELIGAETYVLDKVRDIAMAQKFLEFVERFKTRVGWHGHSADGNPSGGNKFRGLYNIYLKSLGAATKRHPDVPLDYVIDYSEMMEAGGFYFMDSPGNDLESIAGQVASGCNMIFFVTGNGSITNFPFVPTIKIVTTTERYNLLDNDMDINAGAYLDGVPLEDVGETTLDYTIDIASGQLSVGEQAGHSQVQIWRDWQLTQPIDLHVLRDVTFSGKAIEIDTQQNVPNVQVHMLRNGAQFASEQVGLILPTSLCSGQIANMCVDALNQHPMLAQSDISRFVTLTHTEGCGGSVNPEFIDTMVGYLGHPMVKHALFLEHGCEATHNDYFRHAMTLRGYNPDDYGWASIQLEGGIEPVIHNMTRWFDHQIQLKSASGGVVVGLDAVRIAIVTTDTVVVSSTVAELTQLIVASGGTVILSEQDTLLQSDYIAQLGIRREVMPTIGYAGKPDNSGFHIMAMPTRNWSEALAGLGTQVDLIVQFGNKLMPGHPMIPMLQISHSSKDFSDMVIDENSILPIIQLIATTLSRQYTPNVMQSGNVNFQVTRGLLGVSL